MEKHAVILAGGKGTRLKPYTISMPKPLVPINEMPIIEIIIKQLIQSGFTRITVSVNYMADMIKAYLGDGSKYGISIDYSFEDKELSTMAPLKLIRDLPENFLVMNGDVLTDLNFGNFFDKHKASNNLFSISAFRRIDKIEYGVLECENNLLVGFKEKPSNNFLVSMGVYMLKRDTLNFIPSDVFFGFDHLMHKLIENNIFPSVIEHNGKWFDIGRPQDYDIANSDFNQFNYLQC